MGTALFVGAGQRPIGLLGGGEGRRARGTKGGRFEVQGVRHGRGLGSDVDHEPKGTGNVPTRQSPANGGVWVVRVWLNLCGSCCQIT